MLAFLSVQTVRVRHFRWLLSLTACLLPLLASNASAQFRFQILNRDEIERRIRGFSGSDSEREERLKKFFADSDCKDVSEQVVKSKDAPNLICVLPGQTDRVILVGAHFDHVSAGDGVVDNWSGASLLPSLFWSVAQAPRQHTYVFVGFTDEEKGLVGSEFYAHHLAPEQRSKIEAMVNMDTLGLGPTEIWISHSDKNLVEELQAVAESLKAPLRGVDVEQVGATDSESFAHYKIPSITIHTLTQATLPILHSRRDRLDAINTDEYYDTYKLVAGYLIFLDQSLGKTAPAPAPAPSPKTGP